MLLLIFGSCTLATERVNCDVIVFSNCGIAWEGTRCDGYTTLICSLHVSGLDLMFKVKSYLGLRMVLCREIGGVIY